MTLTSPIRYGKCYPGILLLIKKYRAIYLKNQTYIAILFKKSIILR